MTRASCSVLFRKPGSDWHIVETAMFVGLMLGNPFLSSVEPMKQRGIVQLL